MCGIVAIARPSGLDAGESGEVLNGMRDALSHRGPDEATSATFDGWVGLGHRRLSIIDIHGSHQPLSNEDGSIASIFNGEIYNFKALRAELQGRGHQFATAGDGEVIVHGYEEWGAGIFARLEGMFALVLVDRRREEVIAARDRSGIKPLFWTMHRGAVLWSSELKGLLAHPGIERRASALGMTLGLVRTHVPWPYTAFEGVFRQPPGSWLGVKRSGRLELRRFAPLVELDPPEPLAADRVEELAERTLMAAVERQLIADVPVGAFLSGGIDSTLIVALMRRLGVSPIHTFSVGVDRLKDDESEVAVRTARALGTTHHEIRLTAMSASELLKIPDLVDEPFAEVSIVAVRSLSRLARGHVRVALSGDGGDEVFGGYDSYRLVRLADAVGKAAGRRLGFAVGASADWLLRAQAWPDVARRALRFGCLVGKGAPMAHRTIVGHGWASSREAQLRSEALSAQLWASAAVPWDPPHSVRAAMWSDRIERLPNAMLTKVDAASMAESLEVRVPMLDEEVLRFAARLRPSELASYRLGKVMLRRVLARVFPEAPAWHAKRGFALPVDAWLRSSENARHMRELLGDRAARIEALTGCDAVREWSDFQANQTRLSAGSAAMRLIWLATVAHWAEQWHVKPPLALPDHAPIA